MILYVVTHNMAGYLPESDPIWCETFADARDAAIDTMDYHADCVAMGPDDEQQQATLDSFSDAMADCREADPESVCWSAMVDHGSFWQLWTIDTVDVPDADAQPLLNGEMIW
jgi:hypothetical protein